jgi:hypothetical protein
MLRLTVAEWRRQAMARLKEDRQQLRQANQILARQQAEIAALRARRCSSA